MTTNRTAILALAAAGALWGLTVPLSKLSLDWLGGGWLTVARFALAAPLLAFAGRRGLRAALTPRIAAAGAIGFGAVILLQNAGIERTSVSHAALVVGAVPVMVALIAAGLGPASRARRLGRLRAGAGGHRDGGGRRRRRRDAPPATCSCSPRWRCRRRSSCSSRGCSTGATPPRSPPCSSAPARSWRCRTRSSSRACRPRRRPPAPVVALARSRFAGTLLPFWLFAYGQAHVPAGLAGRVPQPRAARRRAVGWLGFGEAVATDPAARRRRRPRRHRAQHDARRATAASGRPRRPARSGSSPRAGPFDVAPRPRLTAGTMPPMLTVFDGHNDTLTSDDADRFATGPRGRPHRPPARPRGRPRRRHLRRVHGDARADESRRRTAARAELAAPIGAGAGRRARRPHARPPARGSSATGHVARSPARPATSTPRARRACSRRSPTSRAPRRSTPACDALDALHAAGLRSLGPVWSRPNAFAHGVPFAYPSSPDTGPGLTAAGDALVRRCAELGIAVDLSHLNEAGLLGRRPARRSRR